MKNWNLEKYVADLARAGVPYPTRLAKAGTMFKGRYKLSRDLKLVEWIQDNEPEVSACYMNAGRYMTVADDDRAQYYEGYWMYAGGIFPVHHAWVVRDGKVIDFTVDALERETSLYLDVRKDRYFGVEVPKKFLLRQMFKNKAWMPVSPQYLESLHV